MTKLRTICDVLVRWGVGQLVKDAILAVDGPVVEPIAIDLGVGGVDRMSEFDL